jgi:hypothetical protein
MSNRIKSLSYIKTTTAEEAVATDRNSQQQPELLQNIKNNIKIEELKRKIDTITRYQKPYISKMLNKLLSENPINSEIICSKNNINNNEFSLIIMTIVEVLKIGNYGNS